MPISNPTQLVDAFKKSGEFDRLRKELLAQFQAEVSGHVQSLASTVQLCYFLG